jgi:hypothetical protein
MADIMPQMAGFFQCSCLRLRVREKTSRARYSFYILVSLLNGTRAIVSAGLAGVEDRVDVPRVEVRASAQQKQIPK